MSLPKRAAVKTVGGFPRSMSSTAPKKSGGAKAMAGSRSGSGRFRVRFRSRGVAGAGRRAAAKPQGARTCNLQSRITVDSSTAGSATEGRHGESVKTGGSRGGPRFANCASYNACTGTSPIRSCHGATPVRLHTASATPSSSGQAIKKKVTVFLLHVISGA